MKNFTLILTIGFLWVSVGCVLGQNQTNIWYFGEYQGLDFNSGAPTQLTDGKLFTNEGSATVCDENGNLLLYTDGITVWNSLHEPMPNGNNLNGNKSTTQAALIVPKPGSTTLYYIFTVDADAGKNGLNYSIADMALEEGYGNITTKNVELYTPVTEKITAAMHANGKDVWIITHEWGGNGFYAHLLTENGISKSVKTNTGSAHSGFTVNTRGCMKASADGSKLAAAILYDYKVELFDFDNETGEIKNPVSIPMPPNTPSYGLEFSANGHWLYIGSADLQSKVWQYNITLSSATEIINSAKEVLSLSGSIGSMQLAPDGKIYFPIYFSNRLGAIEKPDFDGLACSAKDSVILFDKKVRWGLPNMVPAFFIPNKIDFTWQPVCYGSPMQFNVSEETRADSVMWNFGDMSAGKMVEFDYGRNPFYTFSQAGQFNVELVVFNNGKTDTISKEVEVWQKPVAFLGADTFICKNRPITFNQTQPSATYKWSNGSTAPTFTAHEAGTYWVEVTIGKCSNFDTIVLKPAVPFAGLGKDTALCSGQTFTLNATTEDASYLWPDGSTSPTFTVSESGKYWVEITNGCGTVKEFIKVTFRNAPQVNLGQNRFTCNNEPMELYVKELEGTTYTWSNGETGPFITAYKPGKYWVEAKNSCGTSSDTVEVVHGQAPEMVQLGEDTTACYGKSITLNVNIEAAEYLWVNGATEKSIQVTEAGNYWVMVKNSCGISADTVSVTFENCDCPLFTPSAFTPNNDIKNDGFRAYGCQPKQFHMQIFNRWGELMWETDNMEQSWDGKSKGEFCDNGVYVYVINARDYDKKILQKKGSFHLLR